jgi:UDP-N-acetylmuramoyl-L-alanyl-D-glutamate--2,6-diaminopimelate ligase
MSYLSQLRAQGVTPQHMTSDSRHVGAGSLFLAYPGERADGRLFIDQAIRQGAEAVLWEQQGYTWKREWNVPNVPVPQLREHVGEVASEFYGEPSRQLWMIGVTGTNGKTSCSHWLAHAWAKLGKKTAIVGTLGNGFPGGNGVPGQLSEAVNTTPDPILLHGALASYLKQGATGVAMEVSSHGLVQGRVNGVHFDVAVLTNLSRDHLDYHGDMAAYAEAKKRLFHWSELKAAVLNADDAFGQQVAAELAGQGVKILTYGLNGGDVRGTDLALSADGLSMRVVTSQGEARLQAKVLGHFNASNLLAVVAALLVSNVTLDDAVQALRDVRPVAGRMQQLGGGVQPLVVVDYAHTPDALEKVLLALRAQTQGRLICVFGCGGNRDQGKRPMMGEVVSRLADLAMVTSDNPRHEAPLDVIDDILAGMRGNYEVEPDRAAAIAQAIGTAQAGDIVLLAGKGHEDYQEIDGVKLPFSDVEVAQRVLGGRS